MTKTINATQIDPEFKQWADYLAKAMVREWWQRKQAVDSKHHKETPEDQTWFWTDEWQAGEREVDQQLANGDYLEFESMEEALKYLDEGA